jgi:hypothetical protein
MVNEAPEAFIFMKVGNHAGETLEQILERKQREYDVAGKIFWGYGGTSCHPIFQAQPFARMHAEKMGNIYLVMQSIISKADPDLVPATQFSYDGVNWEAIPPGINVTGSRYAFVLDQIVPGELEIDPSEFVVDIGPSRGKRASEYLRGHVDKACLVKSTPSVVQEPGIRKKGDLIARMHEPYAVLLR